jgi:hypothetical protein
MATIPDGAPICEQTITAKFDDAQFITGDFGYG